VGQLDWGRRVQGESQPGARCPAAGLRPPQVSQGDAAGLQDIRLRLAEKVMTRERERERERQREREREREFLFRSI